MVGRVLSKESKKFIKQNRKTFLAQSLIVALGVGLLFGMQTACTDLTNTMQTFVDDNNLYDINVVVEYGVEKSDIKDIRKKFDDAIIEPGYSIDVAPTGDFEGSILSIKSYNSKSQLNKPQVKSGRLPEKENECVVDESFASSTGKSANIGEEITVDTDFLKEKKMTVVGTIQSPEFLAKRRGISITMSDEITAYLYVHEDNINLPVYSNIYIKYDSQNKAFTDGYDNLVTDKKVRAGYEINDLYSKKYSEIITQKKLELNTAELEYKTKEASVNQSISEAEAEIREKEDLLKDVRKMLMSEDEIEKKLNAAGNAAAPEIQKKINELNQKIADTQKKINDERSKYNSSYTSIENQIKANDARIAQLNSTISANESKLASMKSRYNSMPDNITGTEIDACAPGYILNSESKCCPQWGWGGFYMQCYVPNSKTTTTPNPDKAALKKEIDALSAQITKDKTERSNLEAKNTALKKTLPASTTINNLEKELSNYIAQRDEQQRILDSINDKSQLKQYYLNQNKTIRNTIASYENQIKEARAELEAKKKEAKAQLDDAQKQLDDARAAIASFEYPASFIWTRSDSDGYSQFTTDISAVRNLSYAFPLIFYIIAFLMISTSIGRLIQENRNQIGTLKAIGFKDGSIAKKYISYVSKSIALGSIVGATIGAFVVPIVIYEIYGAVYEFPYSKYSFDIVAFVIAIGSSVAVAVISLLYSCLSTFREKPVALLRQKQEKTGKKGWLEHIPFIWNNLKVTTRLSLNNIGRYKVRLIMSVVGIGGCMALLLTALSLKSSMTNMVEIQFNDIQKFTAQIILRDTAQSSYVDEIKSNISKNKTITQSYQAGLKSVYVKTGNTSNTLNLVVLPDKKPNTDFLILKNKDTEEEYSLDDDGVVLTDKIAELIGVKEGETFTIMDSLQQNYEIKVSRITENYVYHYAYMTNDYYKKVFGADSIQNMILAKTGDNQYDERTLVNELNTNGAIARVLFTSQIAAAYNSMTKSLDSMVTMLLSFSVLLIVAVLYNLTSINIRERTKEIATYKVLGFSENEVIKLFKRENRIRMIIGVLFGAAAGYVFSKITIHTCEINSMRFVDEISWTNIAIATVVTIATTIAFEVVISRYVKNINLIEALKSNE